MELLLQHARRARVRGSDFALQCDAKYKRFQFQSGVQQVCMLRAFHGTRFFPDALSVRFFVITNFRWEKTCDYFRLAN